MNRLWLLSQYYRLRRMGLLQPLLHEPCAEDGGRLYTFDNPVHPWDSKHHLPWDVFERMVKEALNDIEGAQGSSTAEVRRAGMQRAGTDTVGGDLRDRPKRTA